MSKNRVIAGLISNSTSRVKKVFTDSDNIVTSASLGVLADTGTTLYSSADTLPTSANNGDMALVTSTNRLYIYSGSGWYNIALVNNTPYWITEPDSDYTLELISIDSDVKIVVLAGDSDDTPLTYIASVDSDFNVAATITHDSDRDNNWIVRRRDSESGAGTTGNVTFKASDGVNLVTFVSTFTISSNSLFVPYGGDNLYYAGEAATLLSKFAMVSDTNAATIPAISFTEHKYTYTGGGMSSTNGYIFGAKSSGPYPSPTGNMIERFPFANEDAISSTGYTLNVTKGIGKNKEGIGNRTNIYTAGGTAAGILKFVTSSESNTSTIGNPVSTTNPAFLGGITGHSSETHGYMAGGYQAPATGSNVIQKFPFAVDESASDVGDLTYSSWWGSGSSSTTHGYHAGGYKNPPSSPYPISTRNDIQKFSFASDGNATDVGDLSADGGHRSMGGSSPSNGYQIGNADNSNIIEKYSFSSDGNATDIANFGTNAGYFTDGFGSQDAAG
jgi:hypothetical protein